jgi:hypothetical protein
MRRDAMLKDFNGDDYVYLDGVLDQDMKVLIKDWPTRVGQWLKDHPEAVGYSVFVGRTRHLVSVEGYLRGVS